MDDRTTAKFDLVPDTNEVGSFGTTRTRDPSWICQLLVTRETSEWRRYYREACVAGGYPNHGARLCLTAAFNPYSPEECSTMYSLITNEKRASQENSRVMVYAVSYDHDEQGKMSPLSWEKITSMLRMLNGHDVRVQLWIDKVDSANRTGEWGLDQLFPYVMFPVLRVGSGKEAGFWSNMEGLAGIFGRGLYHDKSLSPRVVQYSSPAVRTDSSSSVVRTEFFASRAATFNAGDAVSTFYLHLMCGSLSRFRNFHEEALRKLSTGSRMLALMAEPRLWLELITCHERDSMYDHGRFEIINGFRCRTDIPMWHGLKEWVTVDRWIHNCFHLQLPKFNINGFVNIYEGATTTKAVVHWDFPSTGWTRRLEVHLTKGSREDGHAISHFRLPGYRLAQDKDALLREECYYSIEDQLQKVYTFDSLNIRWDGDKFEKFLLPHMRKE